MVNIPIRGLSPDEVGLLISLITRRIQIIDCGSGKCKGAAGKKRHAAWAVVVTKFNASPKCRTQTTGRRLVEVWEELKKRTRNARRITALNQPLADPHLAAIEKAKGVGWKSKHRKKGRASNKLFLEEPAESAEEFADQDTDLNSASAKKPPARQKTMTSADEEVSSGVLEHRNFTLTSGPSNAQSVGPHIPFLGQYFGSNHAPVFPPVSSAAPMIQPTSMVPSEAQSFYYQGFAPRLVMQYGPSFTGKVAIGTAFDGTRPVRISEMTTSQDTEAQLQTKRLQLLYEMDKKIYEAKLRTEEALLDMAKELHEAQMNATLVSLEKKTTMEQMQLQRENELHASKLRAEELHSEMQRELHGVQMNTAKLENEQAEISKQILELKLQQAQIELQRLKERS